MVDNLNRSRDRNSVRRQHRVEVGAPAGRTAVTEGSFRILSNEGLYVLGTAVVSGWLIVTGTLKIVGRLLLEGVTEITGLFQLKGDAEFTGNVIVKDGGEITIEGARPVRIGIADNGLPGFQFPSGSVTASDDGVAIQSGNGGLGVADGVASLIVGDRGIGVTPAGVSFVNLPTRSSASFTSNLYVDPATQILYRLIP